MAWVCRPHARPGGCTGNLGFTLKWYFFALSCGHQPESFLSLINYQGVTSLVGAHGKSPGMKRSTTLQCIRRYGDRKSLDPPRIDPAAVGLFKQFLYPMPYVLCVGNLPPVFFCCGLSLETTWRFTAPSVGLEIAATARPHCGSRHCGLESRRCGRTLRAAKPAVSCTGIAVSDMEECNAVLQLFGLAREFFAGGR